MTNNNIVEGWLRSINLVQYTQSFIDNGYDDLEVCKQIGELDVDAIGIVSEEHRDKLLRAVRVLREEGGTAVYFTLEETTGKPLTKTTSFSTAIDTRPNYLNIRELQEPLQTQETHVPGLSTLLEDQTDQKRDEYEVGKITLISYPKIQLNHILKLKLEDDGIVFSNPPYTTRESELCFSSLTALAVKYADELNTHCDDVSGQLQELWHDAMKLDCYPANANRSLVHGFYGSSSVYGFSPRNLPPPIPSIPPPNTSHVEKCIGLDCNLQVHEHRHENNVQQNCLNISQDSEGTVDTKKKTSTINRFLRNIGIRRSGKKHSYKKHSGDPNAGDITMNDDERIALMVMVKEGKISTETALEVVRRFEDKRLHNFNSSAGHSEGKENVGGHNYVKKQNLSLKPMKSHSAIYADVGQKCHICQHVLTSGEQEDSRSSNYAPESENIYICCRHKRVHSVGHIDLTKSVQMPLFSRAISHSPSRGKNPDKALIKPSDGRKDNQLYSPVLMSSFKSMQPILPQGMETIKEKRSGKSKDFMHKTTSRTSLLSSESEYSVEFSQQGTLKYKDHSKYDELKTYCCNSTFSLSSEKTNDLTSAQENEEQKCHRSMSYITGEDVYSETDEHDNAHLLGSWNKGNRNKLGGCLREMRVEFKKKVLKYKEDKAQTLQIMTASKGDIKNSVDNKQSCGNASPREHIVPVSSYHGSIPRYRCSQDSLYPGHYVERVRVTNSYKPRKDEKDFLHIENGDLINVLGKDNSGIWRGVLRGVVGNFHCSNVVIPHDGYISNRKEIKQMGKPGSVEELLQIMGLEHLTNFFLENGFDQLEIFYEINEEDLNVLNITDPEHRTKLLNAAKIYGTYGSEAEVLKGENYFKDSRVGANCNLSERSAVCKLEEISRDGQFNVDKTDKEYSEEDKEVSALTNSSRKPRICNMSPSSPIYLASKSNLYGYSHCCECRHKSEILTSDNIFVTGKYSTLTNQSFYEQLAPQSSYGKHKKVKPVPPPRISSAQSLSCDSQKMNEPKQEMQSTKLPNHADDALSDSSSLQGAISSSSRKNIGSRKDVIKIVEPIYAASRKTLKNISRSLIPLVTTKLGAERIDFSLEPYSTQNGHCGIPPLLVQRYAEELRQDITSVALVLEQVRIIQLQSLDRICVPNEKLAESCSEACDLKIASVKEFFISVGLPMYIEDILDSGVESIDQLLKMTESQLSSLTGADSRHLKRLMHAIEWVCSKLSSNTQQTNNLPFINVIDKV